MHHLYQCIVCGVGVDIYRGPGLTIVKASYVSDACSGHIESLCIQSCSMVSCLVFY